MNAPQYIGYWLRVVLLITLVQFICSVHLLAQYNCTVGERGYGYLNINGVDARVARQPIRTGKRQLNHSSMQIPTTVRQLLQRTPRRN